MNDRTIDHYRIVESLGSGAMGDVFLAEDTQLERRVAIKLLAEELASDPERLARFEREAKTLASLNHPGIVTIFSVHTESTRPYFVMELVEGQRLDELLPPDGLDLARFFELAVPLAEALGAAHERGVVHRDLKPANVMVTPAGRVKVLDFGLAWQQPTVTLADDLVSTQSLTESSLIVGTLPYMAPEQAIGRETSARSDIFSLGTMFYEMLTGRRPFAGDTAPEVLAAIVQSSPAPLSGARSDLPWRLAELVHRCLRRDPGRRPQSALDVRNDLEDIREEALHGTRRIRSIAVLPFHNMSSARDQDYFCEGIAEELITALNRVQDLRVAPRASSFQFRGSARDIAEVGRRLHVDTVLDGSVRRADGQLRVTVELIDVTTGYDLWSARFDREIEDIFAIQDEIARRVVELLEISLSPMQQRDILSGGTREIDAYDFYLRGRQYFEHYDARSVECALEMFEHALERDEAYAQAWAGIADCHSFLYANAERLAEHLARALKAAQRALELDPRSSAAHLSLAVALSYSDRVDEADERFAQAVQLDRSSFDAHYFWARHCFAHGRPADAIRLYERASALRPDDFQVPLLSAQIYDDLGREGEATALRRRGVQLAEQRLARSPDDTRALYCGANGLVALGEIEKGLEWARRAREHGPEEPMLLYNLACIHALAGEGETALDCLEGSVARGFEFREWIEGDSNLDSIREHPRFAAVLARLDGPGS